MSRRIEQKTGEIRRFRRNTGLPNDVRGRVFVVISVDDQATTFLEERGDICEWDSAYVSINSLPLDD